MKVLDLGAHDGYVAAWLMDRAQAIGRNVEVDAVELLQEAVDRARARGVNAVQGAAEHAPDLFPTGSYDAVIMFELVEHVPDMGRLLEAAEAMVKPGGRIYVSTPDGAFGEGGNPHHLRALRAIDLADLLRRRGTLRDMAVGQDGVTVAAYTPAPRRGDIALFTGPSLGSWSPHDIAAKGLGGSETAAVRLGAGLADLGYVVTVYGECDPVVFRDVLFRHHSTFDPAEPRQAVISSRMPEIFDRPVAAKRKLLWLHDTDVGDRLTERRAERLDEVLVLSRWHHRHVVKTYPFLAGKVTRIRNGVHLPYFAHEREPDREPVAA